MAAASATSDYPRGNGTGGNGTGGNGTGGTAWTGADRTLLLGLIAIALLRTASLFASPLGLGVDEAQYWLWSTGFDFGYYTKPPLTSWIIGLSHGLFGHHEWAVRLPAPWLHLATSLILWRAASWLAGAGAGRIAAMIWMTLPSIALGSFVISTDTPLLLCWSAGVLALVGVLTGRLREGRGMLLAGGAFGAAMLAKYAAIYGLAGLAMFVLVTSIQARSADRRQVISWCGLGLFALGMVVVASPNIIWNLANELTTIRHLGDNANFDRQSYSLGGSIGFLAAQFATTGPVVFALMFGILRIRRGDDCGLLLFFLSAPVILVIMVQAFLSEANANWALAAMPALVLWLARWMAQARPVIGRLAIGINLGVCLLILSVTTAGSLGPLTPGSDPFRRLRGWQVLAADTSAALEAHRAATVIADRRATASLLSWHFHNQRIGGNPVTVLVIDADGRPTNHFEQNLAWKPLAGRRFVALDGRKTPPEMTGVSWQAGTSALSTTAISQNRSRDLYIHKGVEDE